VLKKAWARLRQGIALRAGESIPIRKLLATTREQAGVFNIWARQLRTTAPTHHTLVASLPAGQRQCDAPVDAALICAEVFVSERNEDDGDEREGENEPRGYMPLSENDTGVFDLCVPAGAIVGWSRSEEKGTTTIACALNRLDPCPYHHGLRCFRDRGPLLLV
jgi:hypothetical protein